MVIVSLNPGVIRQRVNTNQLIKIIATHTEYGLHFDSVHWLYVMTILGCNEVKRNDSFEFSRNYVKLATLALKIYLGEGRDKIGRKVTSSGRLNPGA